MVSCCLKLLGSPTLSEEILINVTPSESRVAVVENGLLQEIYLERGSQNGFVGNIYQGRVSRVLPGMQAAFVDIGLARTAFLHASDIVRLDDLEPDAEPPPEPPINELVSIGAKITVQIIKDPIGSKGARLTTNISIPSRCLVLLPDCDHIGISVRIEDQDERLRLQQLIGQLKGPQSTHGYIVRTNAEGLADDAFRADMTYLDKVWQQVSKNIATAKPGDCVYTDLSLPVKALRDLVHTNVEKVRVDSPEVFKQMQGFADQFIPDWLDRIEIYPSKRPIFDLYGVEDEIERALDRTVRLKSGGYLIIDQTEAMTTIDVNTGAYVGHRNLEETIYKTNLEAAQAIARQLRLRNLGGIIIIDFIDMDDAGHRSQVLRTLEQSLERDHAKTSTSEITELGLVEMTRKRTTESLGQRLCQTCPGCNGRGAIKTTETVSYEIFREIVRSGRQFEASKILVLAAPAVVDIILEEYSTSVADLEELISKSIRFQREEQYGQEQFDVVLL